MSYTVVWKSSAEAELADIWLSAENRESITNASRVADRLLRENPSSQGESREGGVRIMFVRPLALEFEIYEADQMVHVMAVRFMKERRSGI